MSYFIFPFRTRPSISYKNGGRNFGAGRSGGRKHAGFDLIAAKGTEILAMADGKVITGPYYFYSGTYALEIKHDNGIVIRYGEIGQSLPTGIRVGARVSKGQVIGERVTFASLIEVRPKARFPRHSQAHLENQSRSDLRSIA